MLMDNLFFQDPKDHNEFTVFQDEAGCKVSNYFYHGFLFIDNRFGREILDSLINIKKDEGNRYTEVHFVYIKASSNEEYGYKTRIALKWLNLASEWLVNRKLRFYVLGINKNNLGNFWNNNWRYEKNIYLRFFELGLKASISWFGNDKKLVKPLRASHLFYEYGKYNDDRRDKVIWLSKFNFGNLLTNQNIQSIFSDEKKQQKQNSLLSEFSNLDQLTDLMLGVSKYSFIKVNPKHVGKQECIDRFIDIIEKFNNQKIAFNTNDGFYKNFSFSFFPKNRINKKDFLKKNTNYYIKSKDNFYCDRLTYRQQLAKNQNLTFNF